MKPPKFTDNLNYAVDGIIYAFKTEKNLKIHFLTALLILTVSLWLNLYWYELMAIFFAITLVILAEMFNTAIETIVNLLTLSHHPLAKIAKDVSAGGVLITCLNSIIIAYLIFHSILRKPFFQRVYDKMKIHPYHVIFLLLIIVGILVIVFKALGSKGRFTQGGLISGHAAFAFAASTAILCLTHNKLATILAFLVAILVAQSRVEAKFHRWFEVVFGALIGILASLTIFILFYKLKPY